MSDYQIVRRRVDEVDFEAIQYGNKDGTWDSNCITKIAGFILGFDPDVGTSIKNERILDVVRPVLTDFDPPRTANLELIAWSSKEAVIVKLGDWVLKSDLASAFVVVDRKKFDEEFIIIAADPNKNPYYSVEFKELVSLIYDGLNLSFISHSASRNDIAKDIAVRIIKLGWSKT